MADKKISALTAATTPLDGTEVLPIVQSGATVKVANNDLRPKQIQSNATSGVLQVAGPASAATRVMTTPDANFTVARTDAAQTFNANQTVKNTVTFDRYGDGTETLVVSTNSGNGVYNTVGGLNHVWQAASGELARLSTSGGFNLGTDSADAGAGNFRLANGNLVIGTSGKGIDFSATPGTGTSELLADYEEGTWTPVIRGAGTAGTYEQAITRATYTKVGRQVTLQCYIALAAVVTGGGTSYLQITGAPFTALSPNQFPTTVLLTDMAKSLTTLYVGVSWATTTVMYFPEVQPTTFADFPVANAVANKTIQFTMTYFV
jgi:hypothetical protein